MNLHTAGVSNGARCHRHLEWGCMPPWETDRNRSHDALSREISHRNAARTMRGGDFSTLWRLCIESPSQPKLASSLHNKRLSYWRLTGFGRNDERGARCHRHLERSRMPLWETDRNRSDDTLSREISLLIADGIVTRRRVSAGGIIKLIARRAIHNPRAKGPSNLRTLRPIGPVNLKNLPL